MASDPNSAEALLELKGISKRFGSTQALDGVSLTVEAGRIHALVGENGAGKSTLVKIISGLLVPDEGDMRIDGSAAAFSSPASASQAGIHMVHQELALLPYCTVAENMFLGHEIGGPAGLARAQMARRAGEVLSRLGLDIDVTRPVGELSTAQQQMVEIGRAILRDFRIIILDEPTAALPPEDTERLFAVLRELTARGTAIIYISHRLDEVAALADRITVLKDGRFVVSRPAAELGTEEMIHFMVGRTIGNLFPQRGSHAPGNVVMTVDGLIDPPHALDVSLQVRKGEIVGIYGLEGHGQDEVLACIAGTRRPISGRLELEGAQIPWSPVPGMIDKAVGYISEDRKSEGLILEMSGHANISLPLLRKLARNGWVDGRKEHELTAAAAGEAGVRGDLAAPVRALSGGNQQKVLLARWLAAGTAVFLLNQPTRGVDVGSKSEIYALIRRLCEERGACALVVAREIPELRGLCDRILVMSRGRLVAQCSPDDEEETILAAAVNHDPTMELAS